MRIPRPSAPVTDSRTASSAGATPAHVPATTARQATARTTRQSIATSIRADARQREIGEEPAKAGCDADAGKSAEKGQQNALDKAELEQPARARAERFPNRHVVSRCQPGEDQQVRDIGHSQQDEQSGDGPDELHRVQRDRLERGGSGQSRLQDRHDGRKGLCEPSSRSDKRARPSRQLGGGLGETRAGGHPDDVVVEGPFVGAVRPARWLDVVRASVAHPRNPEFRRSGSIRPEKGGWRDADDGEGHAVHQDGASDGGVGCTKKCSRKSLVQHHHRIAARRRVFLGAERFVRRSRARRARRSSWR